MDKLAIVLLVFLTLSAVSSARPSVFNKKLLPKFQQPSVVRKAALYVNPFDWIGKPTWPHRTVKKKTNKKSSGHSYRWFVEIDGNNHSSFLFIMSNTFLIFTHIYSKRNESLVGHRLRKRIPSSRSRKENSDEIVLKADFRPFVNHPTTFRNLYLYPTLLKNHPSTRPSKYVIICLKKNNYRFFVCLIFFSRYSRLFNLIVQYRLTTGSRENWFRVYYSLI